MKKINILDTTSLSRDELKNLIEKFPFKKDLAKNLGISLYQLNTLIKSHNLNYPRAYRANGKIVTKQHIHIDKLWLLSNWVNTDKSLNELSIEFGVPLKLLENRASRLGVSKKYKYKINTELLFDLYNPNVWYLAGLVATDGYVPNNRNTIELTLTGDSELELLNNILDCFECSNVVKTYYGTRHAIRMSAEGLNDFLWTNFCIPSGAKTFIVGTPTSIPNEDCAKAYVRGCIDGDGHIKKNNVCLTILTASEKLIDGLYKLILDYTGISVNVGIERGYPYIRIGGKGAKKLLSWVYDGGTPLRLERKYQAYLHSIRVDDIV